MIIIDNLLAEDLFYRIKRILEKGRNNIEIDERVYNVSKNKYEMELYQLFRYHLSYYLNYVPAGIKYKEKIILNNLIIFTSKSDHQ